MCAGFGQGRSADLSVEAGVVPAVIADGAALWQIRSIEPFRDALGGAADCEFIESVAAEAHDPPNPRGAEGELGAEAAFERKLVSLHGGEHITIRDRGVFQPKLVLCQIIHAFLLLQ